MVSPVFLGASTIWNSNSPTWHFSHNVALLCTIWIEMKMGDFLSDVASCMELVCGGGAELYLGVVSGGVSKVGWHPLAALAAPSASSFRSGSRSWPGWRPERWTGYQNSQSLRHATAERWKREEEGKNWERWQRVRWNKEEQKERQWRWERKNKGKKTIFTRLHNDNNSSLFSLFSRLIKSLWLEKDYMK